MRRHEADAPDFSVMHVGSASDAVEHWVAPDASDPVQLRHAAKIANAVALAEDRGDDPFDSSYDALLETASHLFDRADRLDTDTKDRALAEKIAREKFNLNKRPVIAEFDNQNESVRDGYLSAALAGIKAGRNAAKAGA